MNGSQLAVHRPRYIYVLGDSHALVFGGRIAEVAEPRVARYLFQTIFAPGIRAEWFLDEDGSLGRPIVTALLNQRVLVDNNGTIEPYHLTQDRAWRGSSLLEGRARPPSLALSCAGFDVMHLIWNLPKADIAIPESVGEHFEIPRICRTASRNAHDWEFAMQCCRALLVPLEKGLELLRRLELRALMILSLTPPTVSDDVFRHMAAAWGYLGRGPRTLTPWRYKVAILMNEALRQLALEHDVPFINSWNAVTDEGLASSRCIRSDTTHLNSEASAAVMEEMIACAARASAGSAVVRRGRLMAPAHHDNEEAVALDDAIAACTPPTIAAPAAAAVPAVAGAGATAVTVPAVAEGSVT